MKKKFLSMVLVGAMVVSLVGCGGKSSDTAETTAAGGTTETTAAGEASADPEVTLVLSSVTTDAAEDAGNKFVELVAEYSGGSIKVDHFPDNQLGDDKTVIEATQIGDIDIAVSSTSPLVNVYPDFYLYDSPYLFLNREDAISVGMQSEQAQAILKDVEKVGLVGLAWWENGFRNYTNNKVAVKTPADVKGMKVRTMENDVHLAAWQALGANPTPMAFSEVFTALQQGTIDAQENPIGIIIGNKFYEVQKYISLTQHVYTPYVVVMNPDSYNSLTDNQKEALNKAMAEATEYQLQLSAENDAKAVETIEAAGSEVIELTDAEKAAFQEIIVGANIFDMVKGKMEHPEYLDQMMEAMK
ncbi:MAG: hypothetical protein K0S18_225 [Anaerocolumna sp.]|jgi:tripartite ATP-independent transporter DctP family solute receptor|nr:hypothetical protein [Anaerocolumna sp.]